MDIVNQNEIERIIEKIKKHLGDIDNQAYYYATLLSAGMGVTHFLLEEKKLEDLPYEIQYIITLLIMTWQTILAEDSFSFEIINDIADNGVQKEFERKTEQEKLSYIIKNLYKIVKKIEENS